MPDHETAYRPRRFFLQTYGCQMNYHDSERMMGMMEASGYEPAADPGDADVIVFNTCSVREKPERKLFAELGRLRKLKEKRPELIIGVSGCMAPRDADIIRERAPYMDFLIGPRSICRLPELVRKAELQSRPGGIDAVDLFDDPTPLTAVRRTGTVSAWVDIIFGCSYNCSFCAVPSARGREVSRPPEQILNEIDELVALGYKEVTLLGQTVNAYGRDLHYRLGSDSRSRMGASPSNSRTRMDFSYLLEQIDRRAPDLRVSFTSPHPQLFTDRLINAVADLPTVCEHVHLPLQSASNEVLRRMKRGYTCEQYLKIVDKLRAAVPDIAITTDLIVGFPGETEVQFRATLRAVEEIQFDQAFMFIYSPRRHTEAVHFDDTVPPEVQKRRLQELIALANDLFRRKNERRLGETFEVLVEGPSDKNPDRLCGRTRGNKVMIFDGPVELTGRLVQARADKAFLWGFEGVL